MDETNLILFDFTSPPATESNLGVTNSVLPLVESPKFSSFPDYTQDSNPIKRRFA